MAATARKPRASTKAAAAAVPAAPAPGEVLKSLHPELLRRGVDTAICEAFLLLRTTDESLKFADFVGMVVDGDQLAIELPSVVMNDYAYAHNLSVDDQASIYCGYIEALVEQPQLTLATLLEELYGALPAAAPVEANGQAAAAPAADTGPPPKKRAAKGTKEAKPKTTPEQDAEFEIPPVDDTVADVTVAVSKAQLQEAQTYLTDLKAAQEFADNETLVMVKAPYLKHYELCFFVTNGEDGSPAFVDPFIRDKRIQDPDQSVVAEGDVAKELCGRYTFTLEDKPLQVDVVPAAK